jgi:hypothetical protein
MADPLSFSDHERFEKAKGFKRPGRVMAGGLRAVYLHPDRVQLVEGVTINGSRGLDGGTQVPKAISTADIDAGDTS